MEKQNRGKTTSRQKNIRSARRRRLQILLLIPRCLACAAAAWLLVIVGQTFFRSNFSQVTQQDHQSPSLWGVRNRQLYVGDSLAYLEGVSAIDAIDPEPVITIDNSRVDLSTPGTYSVIYTATDASGNQCSEEASITVLELPEGWASAEEIEEGMENLIQELSLETMTTKEQVFTIYDWCHENLKYGGHTNRVNVRQAAYSMLMERQGDCYGYYALSKVLFDTLGIPNIDVEKVKNHADDSNHFWSLVSVDGGINYYHFDATPRVGQTESFCLITDEALDAYSDANKFSHNRNRDQYPATPKEDLS